MYVYWPSTFLYHTSLCLNKSLHDLEAVFEGEEGGSRALLCRGRGP